MTSNRVILDLCGGTGGWSKPYAEAGYKVIIVDPTAENNTRNYVGTVQDFLRDFRESPFSIHGILCAPPCTEFAVSGARWWAEKDPELLREAVSVVITCMLIILESDCQWWALENPVGRINSLCPEIGEPRLIFHPSHFGGWLDPPGDAYWKKTLVYGHFSRPEKRFAKTNGVSKMHLIPPGPDRQRLRSITPLGFAKAFMSANP